MEVAAGPGRSGVGLGPASGLTSFGHTLLHSTVKSSRLLPAFGLHYTLFRLLGTCLARPLHLAKSLLLEATCGASMVV